VYEVGSACSTNGAKRNVYRIMVGKPEEKRLLGIPRRRWVHNIKMGLRCDGVVLTRLIWSEY
jgi:hypothetical protein